MRETRGYDISMLILRVVLGLIFVYAGSQKLFGVFGGFGFSGTLTMMHKDAGIPPVLGALVVFAEFFGGLGVLFGVLARFAALGLTLVMVGATFINIRSNIGDLFSNKMNMAMMMIGFPLALLAMSLAVVLMGPGKYGIEQKLSKKK